MLDLNAIIATMGRGSFEDVGAALSLLISTPDIWLWVYLIFAIASTMMPDREALKGWRPILIGAGVLIAVLYLLGVAQQVFLDTLATPITEGLNRLALTFAVVIAIDLLVTGVLGTIEAIIERITGDSATFQNGKLIAMTREEMQRQREQQRAKQERQRQQAQVRTAAGPPSIYKLPLPIPEAPGRDLADSVVVSREPQSTLTSGLPTPAQSPLRRDAPTMIPGVAVAKTDEELAPEKPLQEAHIPTPGFFDDQDDEEDESEVEAEEGGEDAPIAVEDQKAGDDDQAHHAQRDELEQAAAGDQRQHAEAGAEDVVAEHDLALADAEVDQPEMQVPPVAGERAASFAQAVDDLPHAVEQRQPHHQQDGRHLRAADDRQAPKRVAEKRRAAAHEDARRVEVVEHEAERRAHQREVAAG